MDTLVYWIRFLMQDDLKLARLHLGAWIGALLLIENGGLYKAVILVYVLILAWTELRPQDEPKLEWAKEKSMRFLASPMRWCVAWLDLDLIKIDSAD